MEASLDQARDIVNSHDGNENAHIASFSEITNTSYSYIASWRLYHIVALLSSDSDQSKSYLLLIAPLESKSPPRSSQPITLPVLSTLLTTILDKTAVPVPRPVADDASGGGGKWLFSWLLLRLPGRSSTQDSLLSPTSRSLASLRPQLSIVQLARVELRLGSYLRVLHDITSDWFGGPMDEPPAFVPSFTAMFSGDQNQTGESGEGDEQDMTPYSWQDTFVLRLEELLERVCCDAEARKTAPSGHTVDVDVDALRHALTRAIGSFLFDDVEIPRLTWVTGNDEDVIVSLMSEDGQGSNGDGTASEQEEADVAYILPTFGHALWGDPLMEAWFVQPQPSEAMKEGYFGGEEDGTLIMFPRQETKRIWYTVYLALLVLAEEMSQGEEKGIQASEREMVQWARKILPECGEMLKTAPCY